MVKLRGHTIVLIWLALFLCGACSLHGQSLTITASDDSITTDEELIITIEGELGNFSNYATLPDVPGLIVISQQKSFNSNAATKNATVYQTYRMKAISTGDYTIGPAWIQAGTRRVYSNTVHVNVSSGDNPISNGMVFLRCEPDKKTVYTGEKITVFVRLYVADDYYAGGDYPIADSYSGFWMESDLEYGYDFDYSYGSQTDSTVYIKGKRFKRRTLLKEYLYPNAIGDLTLPTYTYSCYLSPDEDVYNYDSYEVSFDLRSEQSAITSLALPPHDTLPGFSGDVGRFQMKSTLSSDSTRAWEPVTYTMWVTGEGNFRFMMAPPLSLPPGFRAQNIINADTTSWNGDEYVPAKMFRYLITPEQEGEYDLSGIAFTYFDPRKKEYITLRSDSFRLHVAPGLQISGDTVNNLPDSFFTKKKKNSSKWIISICTALLVVPALGFVIVRHRKKKKRLEEEEQTRLAAAHEEEAYVTPPDTSLAQANELVRGAGMYLQNGLVLQSVNNLYEAMIVRIGGMTKMRREEISVNTLRYRLRLCKLSEDLINEILDHYEDLKLKRYTLSPAEGAATHILIVRTADLLQKTA